MLRQHTDNTLCGTDHLYRRIQQENPAIRTIQQNIEKHYVHAMTNRSAANDLITLPVVVHIIHNNGPENISDAQVMQGIQHLNDAFRNVSVYNPQTGVDTKIEFCLAQRDTAGNVYQRYCAAYFSAHGYDITPQ